MIDAAAGCLANLFDYIHIARQKNIRSTEFKGDLQFFRIKINGNHPLRATRKRAEHGSESDAAETDHGNALTCLYLAGIDDRPHSRQHRTTEQCGFRQRQITIDLYCRVTGDNRMRGKTGYAEVVIDRNLIANQPPLSR
ncbi:hypothetical protein D3C87_1455650 [compost metagenome]